MNVNMPTIEATIKINNETLHASGQLPPDILNTKNILDNLNISQIENMAENMSVAFKVENLGEHERGGFEEDKRTHGKRHHNGNKIDVDLDKYSKDDAKSVVHSIINWAAITIFFYFSLIYLCISGCCLCAINKARRSQKMREAYSNT
jgi:hypothetical protein